MRAIARSNGFWGTLVVMALIGAAACAQESRRGQRQSQNQRAQSQQEQDQPRERQAQGGPPRQQQPQNRQDPTGPDLLRQPDATNTSEPRPLANGQPLPDKGPVMQKQREYLEQRYDLSGKTDPNVKMSGGRKNIPVGPTARLPQGVTWGQLGGMSPDEIRRQKIFPYTPLHHPLQEIGGMVFPQVQTKAVPGLERVDVEFDLPEAFIPEFPPAMFLTTRPDLGDVSRGQLITLQNFEHVFQDVMTPFQLEGMRLLLQKTTAQRHNLTLDRSTQQPVEGVSCLDCHVNGHTVAQFHLSPDIRPQSERFRIDTSTLRGTFAQTRFGSKRNIRSLDQFSRTEENSAYFDGDIALAERKGARKFTDRETMAMDHTMSILDFPPAPKLDAQGRLDTTRATEQEVRGLAAFERHCASCHPAPVYSDNLAHDLKVERFYGHVGSTSVGSPGRPEGPIKTFPLRGIKDSPPYFHDGRLLTLEDTVEFFNLVLQARMTAEEKADMVAFLRVL
jgi:cytochrome c peroxidase